MVGFFRLVLLGLAGYWGYKYIKGMGGSSKSSDVKGKQKTEPLDLHDADVQDATFKDVDES